MSQPPNGATFTYTQHKAIIGVKLLRYGTSVTPTTSSEEKRRRSHIPLKYTRMLIFPDIR